MLKKFTKSDLKTGMWVRLRNGNKYLVMFDYYAVDYGRGVLIRENGFIPLPEYEDDLTHSPNGFLWDIIEVLESDYTSDILDFSKAKTIWQREEPKTLTQKEHDVLDSLHLEWWIARDRSGLIHMYNIIPVKGSNEWVCHSFGSCIRLKKDLFPFIEWEDEEPYSTTEMLTWKVKG